MCVSLPSFPLLRFMVIGSVFAGEALFQDAVDVCHTLRQSCRIPTVHMRSKGLWALIRGRTRAIGILKAGVSFATT